MFGSPQRTQNSRLIGIGMAVYLQVDHLIYAIVFLWRRRTVCGMIEIALTRGPTSSSMIATRKQIFNVNLYS
jgi:hypothetical protein